MNPVLPFYGPANNSPYDCLSNLYRVSFTIDQWTFTSVEQAMMFGKALLFADQSVGEQILAATHPVQAKRLGRQVRGFDPAVWDAHKKAIVHVPVYEKFNQNPQLAQILCSTGDMILAEASPSDRIWGIGLAAHDPRVANPALWPGKNLLGTILMEVRSQLRNR